MRFSVIVPAYNSENYYLELEINAKQNSEYEKASKYEKIAKVISNMRSRIID